MKHLLKLIFLGVFTIFFVNSGRGQTHEFTIVKSASLKDSFWSKWQYSSCKIEIASNYSGARITIDKGYSEGKEIINVEFVEKSKYGKLKYDYKVLSHKFEDKEGKERKIQDGETQNITVMSSTHSLEKIAKGREGTINIFYDYGSGVGYSLQKSYN